jgi:hypothetical protein
MRREANVGVVVVKEEKGNEIGTGPIIRSEGEI